MTTESHDPYDSADYYDRRNDLDIYTHTEECDALEEALEDAPLGVDLAPWCLENEVTIYAFGVKEWTDESREAASIDLIERLEETYREDLGGGDVDVFGEAERLVLLSALREMTPDVWQVEAVGERTYEGEALLAKVRDLLPQWLEVTP